MGKSPASPRDAFIAGISWPSMLSPPKSTSGPTSRILIVSFSQWGDANAWSIMWHIGFCMSVHLASILILSMSNFPKPSSESGRP